MAQSTDAPSGFTNSLKFSCTTADTSIAADEELRLSHHIEAGSCARTMTGTSDAKQITLSFYAKADSTKTYVAQILNNKHSSFVHNNRTFTVTSSWQRFTMTFQADTDTDSKFDGTLTDAGFSLSFWLHAGSNYTSATLASDWATGTTNRAAGTESFFSATSNTFFITGVQLEVGDTATPFEHRTYGDELARCQRYYYQHSNTGNATRLLPGSAISYDTGFLMLSVQFPVFMRGTPSLVETTGTNYLRYFHTASNTNFNGFGAIQEASFVGANVYNSSSISGLTAGNVGWVRMVDALYKLGFDAEL